MIYKSEIRSKESGDNWRFKNCIIKTSIEAGYAT